MRAYEFMSGTEFDRRPRFSDEMRRRMEERAKKLKAEEERKAPLLVAMYGADRYHEQEMQAMERETAELELERLAVEIAIMQRDLGIASSDRIKALARSARKNRINV